MQSISECVYIEWCKRDAPSLRETMQVSEDQVGTVAGHQRRAAELLIDVQCHHGMNFPNCVFL